MMKYILYKSTYVVVWTTFGHIFYIRKNIMVNTLKICLDHKSTFACLTIDHYLIQSGSNYRERESHSAHLKNIEAELEGQMAKIEQQALKKAKQEHDQDKRLLQQKMNAELTELQTQLRLFQKVCTICFQN